MTIRNYDEWKTKLPEDTRKVVGDCAHCLDEILEGSEVWYSQEHDITVCSVGCLVRLTSKFDVDIDEFENIEMGAE
ncbi:hypothetical protein SAMN05216389_11135 [Oceanobacillus limi]|uniref:Uncharacterized protein n=1 Tax=Oceanobacillus limi TaxID=930131 RepID=A0A1I0EBV6_9BACI|nr:hypothetical protein SAMN05216389_11135 [Oceanobacillus limi]